METLAGRVGRIVLIGALVLAPGARALAECADYISSGSSDKPMTGRLIGSRTVTQSVSQSFTGTISMKLTGGNYQYQKSTTTTYQVGVYEMSDGTRQTVRCDTYTLV